MNQVKVFLDDVRTPPDGWILVKSSQACIEAIEEYFVSDLSLDHDLGNDTLFGTGYDVLRYIEYCVFHDINFHVPNITIHSANPIGRQRMQAALDSIYRMKNEL